MLSKVNTATVNGIEGKLVSLETDITTGLPGLMMVGLADTMVKEARDRVRAALKNSNYKYPNTRIVVSLAPAFLKKRGTHFDLPMAVGILAASKQIFTGQLEDSGFLGELSLDGMVNPVSGVLPMVIAMRNANVYRVFLPKKNAEEASMVDGIEIIPIESLKELVEHLNLQKLIEKVDSFDLNRLHFTNKTDKKDFSEVKGQEYIKRALVIAVGGGHGILLMGSPSSGKTMLSERIPSILPPMSKEEIIETTIINSVSDNCYEKGVIVDRPFRKPHNSVTKSALIGGGNVVAPGEITLAHNGVLFLDELGEFDRNVLEALRIPLETRKINILRHRESYLFPANFTLVAATNPCKCGYFGDSKIPCKCKDFEIENYRSKLSGPIIDRIDMHIHVLQINYENLKEKNVLSSADMRKDVLKIRDIQKSRFINDGIMLNSQMNGKLLDKYCKLDEEGNCIVKLAFEKGVLNARTYGKTLKVARTIADLDGQKNISINHITEALRFREDEFGKNNT